jgi:hypothetical protein
MVLIRISLLSFNRDQVTRGTDQASVLGRVRHGDRLMPLAQTDCAMFASWP